MKVGAIVSLANQAKTFKVRDIQLSGSGLICERYPIMSDDMRARSMDHPSRRSFLELSSVALATAAFMVLSANGQGGLAREKAEHDHSSSDPGQENRPLLGENPNSNTPPPTDHGDVVPLWYSFDLVKKRVEEGGSGPTR